MKPIEKYTLSREAEANEDIARTSLSPRLAKTVIAGFCLVVSIVPIVQIMCGMPSPRVVGSDSAESSAVDRIINANNDVIRWKDRFETELEERFFLQEILTSGFQYVLTAWLHTGNEKAVIGRNGNMFYSKDIEYLSGIDIETRPGNAITPAKCIIDFAEQLRRRGIELLLVPMPLKTMIYADELSRMYEPYAMLQNRTYNEWLKQLDDAGVAVYDPSETLMQLKLSGNHSYLKSDTHFSPQAMEAVAKELAGKIREMTGGSGMYASYHTVQEDICRHGDIYTMLKLRGNIGWLPPETVRINTVLNENNEFWRTDRNADILFMGDSFSNIYSMAGLGWGVSAGLVEHLSRELECPIDAIRRNDEGSIATRRILQSDLMRGKDRLAGKRIVVWQFAMRELTQGDWRPLDMTLGERLDETSFLAVAENSPIEIEGVVEDISPVPHPDEVTYADHVIAVHLTSVFDPSDGGREKQALVYVLAMRDRQLLPAAYLQVGERVKLRLENWTLHESEEGSYNRSEIDNADLMLADPLWGELLKE